MDEIELTLKRLANQGILLPEGYRSTKKKKLIDIGPGSGFSGFGYLLGKDLNLGSMYCNINQLQVQIYEY